MYNNKLLWWVAILILTLTIHGCTQHVSVSPSVIKTRQEMDNVVSLKGIPLEVIESGGGEIWNVHLYYRDGGYFFQTNPEKSYTRFLSSNTSNWEYKKQKPIPLWFKVKYPNLNWTGVPTK